MHFSAGLRYAGEGVQYRALSVCTRMEVEKRVKFWALGVAGGGLSAGLWVGSGGTWLRVWRARAQCI